VKRVAVGDSVRISVTKTGKAGKGEVIAARILGFISATSLPDSQVLYDL
jgi:hypothetical protein